MRRIAAILLLLATGALLRAASTDYLLGESVRQLGLRDGARRPASVKASLSVAMGQRAPNRAGAREEDEATDTRDY